MLDFFLIFVSLVLLYIGAELSLNASEKIGVKLKLSPLMVGMLLVGLGTSLPEFFVSHIAAYRGEPDMALGNVLGSNITNIFLVLGIALFLVPIKIKGKELKSQVLFHLILTTSLFLLLLRHKFDLLTVLILFVFFLVYMVLSRKNIKSEAHISDNEISDSFFKIIPTAVIGFTLLYYGGEVLVSSGKKVCIQFGLSEYVVSAILVAFGTSFPELITTVVAASRKKHTNLILGNIFGSNIFNIAFVLGTLFPYQFSIGRNLYGEAAALITVSLVFLYFAHSKHTMNRWLGCVFVSTYGLILFYWL